jgi:hypothetical protein
VKYAIIRGNHATREQVQDYLPSNYNVVHVDPNGQGVLIAGEDDHGWTMDDYVLPRLASGLMPGKEVWPVFTNSGETGPVVSMDVPFDWIRMDLHRSAS